MANMKLSSFYKITAFLGFAVAALFFTYFSHAAPQNCGSYNTGTPPPSEYGAVYNVFSPSQMLFKVSCDTDGATLQVGGTGQVVYEKGYYYKEEWKEFKMSGVRYGDSRSVYLKGPVEHVIPENLLSDDVNYVVTYTCVNQGGGWKCGCSDTTCAAGKWQLQSFLKAEKITPLPTSCSITSPCPGNTPCIDGKCVAGLECNITPGGFTCSAGKTCINGYCVSGSGNICNTTPGGFTCPSGQTCIGGICVFGSGNICNTTPGGFTCPVGEACINNMCVPGSGNICNTTPGGFTCPTGETCGPDNRCRRL